MKKLLDLIEKFLPREIFLALLPQVIILFGFPFAKSLLSLLPLEFLSSKHDIPTKYTIVLTLCLLYISMLTSYIILYRTSRQKLIPKAGIYWDKSKEAYCPACQALLSEYGSYQKRSPSGKIISNFGFTCIKCNKSILLMHEGKNIQLEAARQLLNDKKNR
jgi:RNase P subunit RPR2